ncbi:MAG: TorF family putative porin [Burkholderiales bacterium]|nr:TorF family putative porin [Burkholderiales bacterium]
MIKKTIMAGVVAAAFAPGLASAQAAPASDHTLTGNAGIFSQYIFRGNTQTNTGPALQGGADYSHSSGLYAGTWLSNISWLTDSPGATGYSSSSLEWDVYGGYKGTIGKSDFGYDVGVLFYVYPGSFNTAAAPKPLGISKADTQEIYGALTWKWVSAKYSYSIGNKTFGVEDSRGTWYLDLTANYPITDKLTGVLHYGKQKFAGTNAALGVSNDSFASFEDYKIGLSYALPKDFTVGGFFTGTSMKADQKLFYTNASDTRFTGKDTFTVFVSKTF